MSDGVDGGLAEVGGAADDAEVVDRAVGGDDGVESDAALNSSWRIKGEYTQAVTGSVHSAEIQAQMARWKRYAFCVPRNSRARRVGCAIAPRRMLSIKISVLTEPASVMAFLRDVQAGADTEKNALGFFPGNVYEEAARRGCLFVAVTVGENPKYVGHILFGDTYPHARIYQTFVIKEARKNEVGTALVNAIAALAERQGFLSLIAKVAADLPANRFYESMGFECLAVRAGGASRNRNINVRVRTLNTPKLFGYREPVSDLPLPEPSPSFTPVLALDLNVFFDVAKRRPRATYSGAILSASFSNLVQLTATEELAIELRRTSISETDTALEFASQLPTLPAPPNGIPESVIRKLAEIVFPERAAKNTLTVQDNSDLRHLAIAAHHTVSAFVTAEDALVVASPALQDQFGLRVMHVRDLAVALQNASSLRTPSEIGFAGGDLKVSALTDPLSPSLKALAENSGVPAETVAKMTATGLRGQANRSLIVSFDGQVIAAASWNGAVPLNRAFDVILVADEEHAAREVAVDIVLSELANTVSSTGPARIQLGVPKICLYAQRGIMRCGYKKCQDHDQVYAKFQHVALGVPVTATNWDQIRRDLKSIADMTFPDVLPVFSSLAMKIDFETADSKTYAIDLFDLETTLSPTSLLLEGRGGALVPIQARFANDLLGTSEQASLFPRRSTTLIHERTYFCSPRVVRLFPKGTVVIFYESGAGGGRKSAVALARVKAASVVAKKKLGEAVLESGVLDETELGEITLGAEVTSLTFDNVLRFKSLVPLNRLREIGCIDGSNAVTSRAINSLQLKQIVTEGMRVG